MLKNSNSTCERDNVQMNYQEAQMSYGSNMSGGCCGQSMPSYNPCPMPCCPPNQNVCCQPICECPQNQVCHRVINYDVPHIKPMNTTVVNHHIYNHTYTPVYSYNEVDEVENVYRCGCSR